MTKEEHKPNQNPFKNISYLVGIAVLIIIVFIFGAISFSMITNKIISNSVYSMERLAKHDEQAIESNLNNKWNTLERIAQLIRQNKCETTEQLLAELGDSKQLMECIRMTLVADNGNTINSTMTVLEDQNMLQICENSDDHFIYRINSSKAAAIGRGELLILGVKIQPFTVEQNTYTYLVARLDISTFESELKLDSYDGRGSGFIIDLEGNYIVNANRNYTAQKIDNFYNEISLGKLKYGYTPEKVRQQINENEHVYLEFINEDKTVFCMNLIPIEDRDWYFIMSVPKSVFIDQSFSLMMIFIFLVAIIILAAVFAVFAISRRRSKMLAIEKKYREELSDALVLAKQANRAKTTFLNNMSHDIRTPMNAIIGFTALASVHIDNKERVEDYLAKISQSSNHLLSLINDILDMSRIESEKMHIDEKPENIAEILHGLRNIVQSDINAKQLEFFIDTVDVTDEDIYCDKLRLNQILLNVLSNAIKFTPPGGTVSVRITENAVTQSGYAEYEFKIKDTGIGMSPEFINSIFEPFTRERNSTVSGIQGTGLGMSITKNIVDMMGGTIDISSEEGKGSEFIITLKFRLQKEHKEVKVIKSLEGLRGLVVDDDINTCQSVSQMLRQIGMRSEWTMYGKEAVARTEEAIKIDDKFHVYIIDWQMPDINGIETARRIRAVVGNDVPIIILSAYDWADIEAEARDAGVTDFISKPMFPSDLHHVLLKTCGELKDKDKNKADEVKFKGNRILLVEDNELNREIAAEILQESGFVIETAENGKKAVEVVEKSEPGYFDLVLMDIQMPVMNGFEATKAIRGLKNTELSNIPIIAMTANAFEEDKKAAYNAGMNAHIGKPIDVPLLMRTLKKFMNNPPEDNK